MNMEIHYRDGGAASDAPVRTVKVAPGAGGAGYAVTLEPRAKDARARAVTVSRSQEGVLHLEIDGRKVRVHVADDGARRVVQVGAGAPVSLVRAETRRPRKRAQEGGAESLVANMHGQVVLLPVKPGDVVERGQVLVVLEAMKMELKVQAPHRGRVAAIGCKVGEVVERGRVLVTLEAAPPE